MGDSVEVDTIVMVLGIASIVISGAALSVSIGLSDWFNELMKKIGKSING